LYSTAAPVLPPAVVVGAEVVGVVGASVTGSVVAGSVVATVVFASVVGTAVVLEDSVAAVEVGELVTASVVADPSLSSPLHAANASSSTAQRGTIDRRARITGECLLAAGQILRSATSVTRWSSPLRMISEALVRVGSMFSRRFLPLISFQMKRAVSIASG